MIFNHDLLDWEELKMMTFRQTSSKYLNKKTFSDIATKGLRLKRLN